MCARGTGPRSVGSGSLVCCEVRASSCGQAGPASTRHTGRCHTPRLSADYCYLSPVVYACGVHGPRPSPCVSLVSSSRQCAWSCVVALPLMLTFTGIVLPRHCSLCAACLVVSGSPVVIAASAAWLAVETEWPYFCGGSYACATFTDCARLWSDCRDTYGVTTLDHPANGAPLATSAMRARARCLARQGCA